MAEDTLNGALVDLCLECGQTVSSRPHSGSDMLPSSLNNTSIIGI